MIVGLSDCRMYHRPGQYIVQLTGLPGTGSVLVAGASAVQVGTASFANPNAGVEVATGIQAYCEERGIDRVASLVGSLQP